jgi:hypothetical protein
MVQGVIMDMIVHSKEAIDEEEHEEKEKKEGIG